MKRYQRSLDIEIKQKRSLQYLLYLPEGYDAKSNKKWPLILFLHGSGERGDDLKVVENNGPPMLIARKKKKFPFIVVCPQCPNDSRWSGLQLELLNALLDEVASGYRIDEQRIYLTGLSMGGFGTWRLAMAYPDRFAAIAPVCGGGDPDQAPEVAHLPTWVFHGAKDDVVSIENSKRMVDALKKAGGNVKFTIYPDGGHDSWTETYNNPELYDWFLNHSIMKGGRKSL
jgi:predicted peptidase